MDLAGARRIQPFFDNGTGPESNSHPLGMCRIEGPFRACVSGTTGEPAWPASLRASLRASMRSFLFEHFFLGTIGQKKNK